jgi:hypothetical protein
LRPEDIVIGLSAYQTWAADLQPHRTSQEAVSVVIMKSQISSAWTFFGKFIFPIPFAVFALMQLIVSERDGTLPPLTWPLPLIYVRVAFPILIVGLVILDWGNLKRLYADKETLYISNYLKEIVVSVSKIQSIEEYPGPRLKAVRINFSEATDFGTAVEFIPKDFFPPWRRSAVVSDLRKLANLSEP